MTKPNKEVNKEEVYRKLLWVPCKSKKDLHRWIKLFLGFDMPDCTVDDKSTSNPMDAIWEIYSKCIADNDPNFSRALYFAARESMKTMSFSILEILALFHLNRDVCHMAAIEQQSLVAQEYVKMFLNRPYLRDFVVGDAKRYSEILYYHNLETDERIPEKDWKERPDKDLYVEKKKSINVILCTPKSANSAHTPLFIVDEVDLIDNIGAYEEAKMVPSPRGAKYPITVLTSSRKYSFGLVQEEIDSAQSSGLQVKHWNIIDVTKACPPERHRPDLPKLKVFRSEENLQTITPEAFAKLLPEEQGQYREDEAYWGCVNQCKLFAVCKGNLSHKQKSNSFLLKDIDYVTTKLREVSLPAAKAQLLCWRPSSEGLVYPNFSTDRHTLSAREIAERITGQEIPQEINRDTLIKLLKTQDVEWFAGIDHGYSHCFAVTLMVKHGNTGYIVGAWEIPELELGQKIDLLNRNIKGLNPLIFADPEAKDTNVSFTKNGFKLKQWKKGKGSVLAGIEIVRYKLNPTVGEPSLFILKGDPGCDSLAKKMSQYAWKRMEDGTLSEYPDDKNDDILDSTRYCVMNVFSKGDGALRTGNEQNQPYSGIKGLAVNDERNWLQKKIDELVDNGPENDGVGSKGRFKWIV